MELYFILTSIAVFAVFFCTAAKSTGENSGKKETDEEFFKWLREEEKKRKPYYWNVRK